MNSRSHQSKYGWDKTISAVFQEKARYRREKELYLDLVIVNRV